MPTAGCDTVGSNGSRMHENRQARGGGGLQGEIKNRKEEEEEKEEGEEKNKEKGSS